MPLKVKISITLDTDVLENIKELAEEDDRNVSQYVNIILKQHIKEVKGEEVRNATY